MHQTRFALWWNMKDHRLFARLSLRARTPAARLAAACALQAALLPAVYVPRAAAGEEPARLAVSASLAGSPLEFCVVRIRRDGQAVIPRGFPPARVFPDGGLCVASTDVLTLEAGHVEVTAAHARLAGPMRTVTLVPGETTHVSVPIDAPVETPLPSRIVFTPTGDFDPAMAAAEGWVVRTPPPWALRDTPEPARAGATIVRVVPDHVPLPEFAAQYARRLDLGVPMVAAPAAGATPLRQMLLPHDVNVSSQTPPPPGAAGITEGPGIVLTLARHVPGGVLTIDAPVEHRVRATAWDPDGMVRIEILSGSEVLVRAERADGLPVLQATGRFRFDRDTVLVAHAVSAGGAHAVSGAIAVRGTGPWQGNVTRVQAAPLAAWTAPQRAMALHFQVRVHIPLAERAFLDAGGGARIIPSEFPLALRAGDRVTLSSAIEPPAERDFPAALPVTLRIGGGAVWHDPVLLCPWECDTFAPDTTARLRREGARYGLHADGLTLAATRHVFGLRGVDVEVFSDGTKDAGLDISVQAMPPRVGVTLTVPVPPRRGWHPVTFDLGGIHVSRGGTFVFTPRGGGTLLIGSFGASKRSLP